MENSGDALKEAAKATQLLVASGADEADGQGMTALHIAAEAGAVDRVVALLAGGASVNSGDAFGWAPLHFAASNGHVACVRALVDGGASVDAREAVRWTPLHMAAMNGRAESVRALVELGAYERAVNDFGLSAAHVAARSGHVETTRVLASFGVGSYSAFSSLDVAYPTLTIAAADPNSTTTYGDTPMHLAASNGYTEVVRVLVESGAEVGRRNGAGHTGRDVALARGKSEAATYLESVER